MKRLIPLLMLFPLMGADDCSPSDQRNVAARSLSPIAICTWKDSDRSNWEIICIDRGRRYSCLVARDERVSCAATNESVSPELR